MASDGRVAGARTNPRPCATLKLGAVGAAVALALSVGGCECGHAFDLVSARSPLQTTELRPAEPRTYSVSLKALGNADDPDEGSATFRPDYWFPHAITGLEILLVCDDGQESTELISYSDLNADGKPIARVDLGAKDVPFELACDLTLHPAPDTAEGAYIEWRFGAGLTFPGKKADVELAIEVAEK